MNPGLVVKLRPSGPWRIGPDSGARNRVDVIYHSDSLYSAVTSAMARLGSLEEWLDATARSSAPAVCFSSCFPFLDEIGFVVPPRTVWPPASPALMSARVRWKTARFVPLEVVQAILAGQPLEAAEWAVDGPSECLVPAGRPGPFRTGLRSGAAVDRLSGATERHSMACIEFRQGAGLWTIVSFADADAQSKWAEPVKAAFRLLADSGFGGERSRGWGRAETPEFIEGNLPDMILGARAAEQEPSPVPPIEEPPQEQPPVAEPPAEPPAPDPEPEPPAPEPVVPEPVLEAQAAEPPAEPAPPAETPEPEPAPEPINPEPIPEPEPAPEPIRAAEETRHPELYSFLALGGPRVVETAPAIPAEEPTAPEPVVAEAAPEPEVPTPAPFFYEVPSPIPAGLHSHWLLSLFTPSQADTVDWSRGNYTVLSRGGRVDSPAGSGDLKKQLNMVTEGSVVYAASEPRGGAADVAPDGFAHPVFRAGFALSIPLPEVR